MPLHAKQGTLSICCPLLATWGSPPHPPRGLPPPLHSSVRQVPVLAKPQCMLLRSLGSPLRTSAQMDAPGAAEPQCALMVVTP
jgi:hypothetical protein